MPWFRATVIDQNKRKHTVEFFAGCRGGAKQVLMLKFGITKEKYSPPIGGKMDIIIRELIEIDTPNS